MYYTEKINSKGKVVKVKMAGENPNPDNRETWVGHRPTIFSQKKGVDKYNAQHNQRGKRIADFD